MTSSEATAPVRGRKKEILFFLLPNLFTTANLFFGFYSVLASIRGEWENAAFSIFIAAFADGFDGRVARMTRAQSSFGEQYDSMADLMSFGMAPAMLFYLWALQPYGRWGYAAAFVFLLCAALRLTRFNVLKQTVEKRYFQGLPSPLAGLGIASAVLFYRELGREFGVAGVKEPFMLVIVLTLALTMISTIRYRSFKDLKFKSQKTFAWIMLIGAALVVFSPKPELTFFPIGMFYVVFAPVGELVRFVWQKVIRARLRVRKK
ncbi:MAG: CDP-diacylglycerol--serine O-phosphatidyltransferase [Bdellovibrionota bacterium]